MWMKSYTRLAAVISILQVWAHCWSTQSHRNNITQNVSHDTTSFVPTSLRFCRDSWRTRLPPDVFVLWTCSKCFYQLFMGQKLMWNARQYPFLLHSITSPNITYLADADNPDSEICSVVLQKNECTKWRECCQAAKECCLSTLLRDISQPSRGTMCPATWDGMACWPASPPNQMSHQSCPSHYTLVEVRWMSPQASKFCEKNGTWNKHPVHQNEATNYKACFDESTNHQILQFSLIVEMSGNAVSIVALIIAIALFLHTRKLRQDLMSKDSFKIHVNFFTAVLLMDISYLSFAWVYLDAIQKPENPHFIKNTVWCRISHTLTKYFRSTTYMSMFCEGLYLYRRIAHVMSVGRHESLKIYFVLSWVFPATFVSLYGILRVVLRKNERCWIDTGISYVEFVHIGPNLLALGLNFLFLIHLQWTLCTKMRVNASEPTVVLLRRAMRASLSLVPVFGLQFLFIIYRPPHWPPYEIIAAIFTSTQGFFVAVLYCCTTREVNKAVKSYCRLPQDQKCLCCPCCKSDDLPGRSTASRVWQDSYQSYLKSQRRWSNRLSLPDVIYMSERRGSRSPSQVTQRTLLSNGSATGSVNNILHLKPSKTAPSTLHRHSFDHLQMMSDYPNKPVQHTNGLLPRYSAGCTAFNQASSDADFEAEEGDKLLVIPAITVQQYNSDQQLHDESVIFSQSDL